MVDPDVVPGVFDGTDLTPRERLVAAFDLPASTPLCPCIAAPVELHDPEHPASRDARPVRPRHPVPVPRGGQR